MSFGKSILLLTVGATFATGALYVIQRQEQFPFLARTLGEKNVALTQDQLAKAGELAQLLSKTVQPKQDPSAPPGSEPTSRAMADVMGDIVQPVAQPAAQADSQQAPQTPEAREANVEIQKALQEQAPGIANRETPGTATETMQAALALQKQMNGSTTGNGAQDKLLEGIDADARADAERAKMQPVAEPNRQPTSASTTTVIVMDGTTAGVDPSAEDKINALNVPATVRQEILKNYRRTGRLPSYIEQK